MCGDGDWARDVTVVSVGRLSGEDAIEDAVDVVLWGNDIEILNKGRLMGVIVWRDEKVLCKTEERDKFEDSHDGAAVWRAGQGDEDVEVLWRLGRAEE